MPAPEVQIALQQRGWPILLSSEDITILVVLLRGHAEHTKNVQPEWSARLTELKDHLVASMAPDLVPEKTS